MTTARTPFVGGNWKMNTDSQSAAALAAGLAQDLGDSSTEVAAFVPFPYFLTARDALGSSQVALGAQDFWHQDNGAFTGEVSTDMLKDCGVSTVLVGHSERRHVIGETDELIALKLKRGLDQGLQVVLCIGELLEEREKGETDEVNERQVRSALLGIDAAALSKVVVAYEPVWAIGTGKTATPEDAQNAHERIRAVLRDMFGDDAANAMRIIYGGSMKPGNAADLMAMPDIDGGLIGGASLKSEDFLQIVQAADAQAVS